MPIKRAEYWFVALSLLVLLCASVCGSGQRMRTVLFPITGGICWSENFTDVSDTKAEVEPVASPPVPVSSPSHDSVSSLPTSTPDEKPAESGFKHVLEKFSGACASCVNSKSHPSGVGDTKCRLCIAGQQSHLKTRGKNATVA